MRRSQLLICIVITSLVMIFTVDVAKAFFSYHATAVVEKSQTKLFFGAASTTLPISNDSNNQDIPQIKAASSFSSLPSALSIQTNQGVICLFEIQYEIKRFNNYQPSLPVALTHFFLVLFGVIVSPNAP